MTDEPEFPFDGLDAERPLPPELRARLEAALLAAVADGLPVPIDAESLDAPRPLPEPLRARLESALLAEAAASPPATAPAGEAPAVAAAAASPPAAAPTSAPAPTGTVVPLESRRRKVVAWWSAVAAVLVFILGAAGLVSISGDGGSGKVEVADAPTTTTADSSAPLPSGAGDSAVNPEAPVAASAPTGPAATATTRGSRPRPTTTTRPLAPSPTAPTENTGGPSTTMPATQPQGDGTQPAPMQPGGSQGSPPPFYDSPAPSGDSASPPAMTSGPQGGSPSAGSGQQGAAPNSPKKSNSPAAPAGPALRVGIIPGDAAQEAGFRAYINRLNQGGGLRGRSIELVTVGPGSPGANTIATVNLGTQPVAGPGGAPSWATSPLLETLTATENLLPGAGAVFSFASAPERQGHLAADAIFPADAPGKTAVVYRPAAPGPLRDVVPQAIRKVLESRKVNVDFATYDPPAGTPLQPADAAFVSLDPAGAKAWVAELTSGLYPAGVAGIYSLFDEALLADLPEGARVVSPYVTPGGDEGQAIRSAGSGSTSASVLHGWATAKSLAAAMWRSGADTPAEIQTALEGLNGWSSGLAPAYETRPNTRSRTPEGVVFLVQSKAFVPDGGFRKDPH